MEEQFFNDEETEEKKEQFLHFPELDLIIKKEFLFSIEKDIEVVESGSSDKISYTIVINRNRTPKKIYYDSSTLRDKRFNQILKGLEKINIKVNTL